MIKAHRPSARAKLARAVAALALIAAIMLALAASAGAAEPSGFGELTRFGSTGTAAGQITETGTHAIGVDPTDNSVYVLDEPQEAKGAKRFLRLQKFGAGGSGEYAPKASVEFSYNAPEEGGAEPTVEGLAIDPTRERVYLLTVALRKKSIKHAGLTQGGGGLLVASALYAFSTKESGSKLVEATGTKAGGILTGEAELGAQSEAAGEALLQPHGITVDPATGDVIIVAHESKVTEKEDKLRGASDHYVLQRVKSDGTLAARYVDKTDVFKQEGEGVGVPRFPSPHSPVVSSVEGKEHVYVGFIALAEVPSDFTSSTPPVLLGQLTQGIAQGIGSYPEGGGISAAPDGTVYGANTAGISNEEAKEGRAGVIAFAGSNGAEIGWTGGAQLHASEPKQTCVISPLIYSLSPLVAAGSAGKLFVLAPEYLLRKVEGEPTTEEVENPPGSGEFEIIETPTFESLSGPFYPTVVEFGPGGSGCPQASATAPVAKVNNIEVKGEEAVKPGSEVVFSSQLKQADALKVEWEFGDGAKETISTDEYQATTAKHKYAAEGSFTVTEKIYADNLAAPGQSVYSGGHLLTPTLTVTRKLLVGKHPPKASFTEEPGTVGIGQAVAFANHSSDPNGAEGLPLESAWSFGDGTSSGATNVSHSYAAAGSYTVTLTVTDKLGLKASASQVVTVNEPVVTPPPPVTNQGGGGGSTSTPTTTTTTGGGSTGVLSYRVSIASSAIAVSKAGVLVLKVDCGGQSSCSGSVTLRSASAISAGAGKHKAILTFARGSFTAAGRQVKSLTLHLSSQAKSLLARMHVLRAKATIVARDAAGTSHTTTVSVTLRAAKHH